MRLVVRLLVFASSSTKRVRERVRMMMRDEEWSAVFSPHSNRMGRG